MRVEVVPILEDNYAYLLIDEKTKTCAAVDPSEPEKVIKAAKEHGVQITHVLTTHSHWDHAGGNDRMAAHDQSIKIIGGAGDGAEGVTEEVKQGDVVEVGSLKVHVLSTPCHTPGHICFFVNEENETPVVFTGDTLFVGGCGNFNSGTPAQMVSAMISTLGKLPKNTLAYVGHEYTVKNLLFAAHAEPNNEAVRTKLEWAKAQVQKGLFTVPTTLGDEWATNPFMRIGEPDIIKFTGKSTPVEVMLAVRTMKSAWRPK